MLPFTTLSGAFVLANPWSMSLLLVALAFVLLMFVVWRASALYSCTDAMDLSFRSRGSGAQKGEPALRILLDSCGSRSLSVIIPAYKEATRVPQSLRGTLLAAVDHLQEHQRQNRDFSWEIIVVDDGSPDDTANAVIQWTNHLLCAVRIRFISMPCNMGKGAVKTGMYVNVVPHRGHLVSKPTVTPFPSSQGFQ
jgi:hypothetical protein